MGLIPARAGKTTAVRRCLPSVGAHPRAGGENPPSPPTSPPLSGSSPRGRGKHGRRRPHLADCGLIPARAGKTTAALPGGQASPAHPRAGGENRYFFSAVSLQGGSSPRGRGKPIDQIPFHAAERLIPARAGKTVRSSRASSMAAAHPRAGGENGWPAHHIKPNPGSSPRGRGKRPATVGTRSPARLIPARAGKTTPTSAFGSVYAAHPRAGGENAVGGCPALTAAGSSPRGRGKLCGRWVQP